MCVLLKNLANFDKLESLTIRQNKINGAIMNALVEGISKKKELRVSSSALIVSEVSRFIVDG